MFIPTLFILLAVLLPKPVLANNLINASAAVSNARLSYIANVKESKIGSKNVTIKSSGAPNNDTVNLYPRDLICFADWQLKGCRSTKNYQIEKILDSSSFTLTEPLQENLEATDYVIVKQLSDVTITLNNINEIPTNGKIVIIVPAVDKTEQTADNFPDSNGAIISNGFDLDGLDKSSIKVSGCNSNNWSVESITPGTATRNHEIVISRQSSSCPANSDIKIVVGKPGIINPAPIISNHKASSTDSYNIGIKTKDALDSTLDEVSVKINFIGGLGVSAEVGTTGPRIYGYTSPQALIRLEGVNLSKETFSNKAGYFEFPSPFASTPIKSGLKEACLSSQDQFGRVSSPVCITRSDSHAIGPIIISPTISLNKNRYFEDQEIIISGQTIPHSQVSVSLFNDHIDLFNLIKSVEAFGLPRLDAVSDAKGNFSISYPSIKSESLRFFSQAQFETDLSPKSITLHLDILPLWVKLIKYILVLIFLILLFIAVYFANKYFHPHKISRNRALVLKKHFELATYTRTI